MTDKTDAAEEIANEITAAARQAREIAERAEGTPKPGDAKKWPLAQIGIGIGSAALAAAVIYAARSRKKD
ncbi:MULTISPECIES: hypothetical protein [unclassified Sphingomonas]|uniref:hypothetical protein n=1 Tax=unclassified Sphingomonas TaxID=196159 RepID=UPI002150E46F|nr:MULTISPECIES: hypothetical protein [unclassified Sphingomonas]MCR5871383.1 hypothetical protein [Sphingomonas sp. J344]UUY00317.1 hypothetical protein LRS08_04170 [Sphingomonas sp. J315]